MSNVDLAMGIKRLKSSKKSEYGIDNHTNLIKLLLELDDLFCLDLDVGGLPARPTRRLVDHDSCVWQRVPHSVFARRLGTIE